MKLKVKFYIFIPKNTKWLKFFTQIYEYLLTRIQCSVLKAVRQGREGGRVTGKEEKEGKREGDEEGRKQEVPHDLLRSL